MVKFATDSNLLCPGSVSVRNLRMGSPTTMKDRLLKPKERAAILVLLTGVWSLTATCALAQPRGEMTVRYAMISPVVALIAGILILIIPRLLNYIVALYLIVIGLIGIFGR